MTLPTTPEHWAIHLSRLLKMVQDAHGGSRFPINIAGIAQDYSRQVYPDEPITLVQGMRMSPKFEGAFFPSPHKKGEWGIAYNENIQSRGRKNFTLAHELGHYLLHRKTSPSGIECEPRHMLDWKSEYAQIEAQANIFASYLLMPLDDVREQIAGQKPTMALMEHLANRYEVSRVAAILKWLDMTDKRAMLVVGKDGFIDWSRSSEPLLKSGVFYRAKQETTELPAASLAAKRDPLFDNFTGLKHTKGVWLGNEDVLEMTVLAKTGEITTTLLIYPDDAPVRFAEREEEPELMDAYDKFSNKVGGDYVEYK
ncbi:MAG: ImmA/IrrE family metallo-endopeptidase [Alphaproteobacteria bacterium]